MEREEKQPATGLAVYKRGEEFAVKVITDGIICEANEISFAMIPIMMDFKIYHASDVDEDTSSDETSNDQT